MSPQPLTTSDGLSPGGFVELLESSHSANSCAQRLPSDGRCGVPVRSVRDGACQLSKIPAGMEGLPLMLSPLKKENF